MNQASEQLQALGFSARNARDIARSADIRGELPPNFIENCRLLRQYTDFDSIQSNSAYLAVFLKGDPEKNRRLMAVPEQLGYSDAQKAAYFADPSRWQHDISLKSAVEACLKTVVGDEAWIHEIVLKYYDGAAWISAAALEAVCEKLCEIRTTQEELERYVKDHYSVIFSVYADFVDCADAVCAIVGKENALRVLTERPQLPRLLTKNDFLYADQWDSQLAQLKAELTAPAK